jgi:hypothetical protein
LIGVNRVTLTGAAGTERRVDTTSEFGVLDKRSCIPAGCSPPATL